jgi:hypothetical protein
VADLVFDLALIYGVPSDVSDTAELGQAGHLSSVAPFEDAPAPAPRMRRC